MSDQRLTNALPEHLYVHVPICHSKCAYCDFYSLPAREVTLDAGAIVSALVSQAEAWIARGLPVRPLRSLYIGGGTPSMLGDSLPWLVRRCVELFGLHQGAEVTIEANPDSLVPGLAVALVQSGVTRISLGVQSLDDAELAMLGRAHSAASARAAAADVVAAGADLSIDLMCGLPGQSMATWRRTLKGAALLGPVHVSVYPLSLEEGTPLAGSVARGELSEPDPDLAAEMMLLAGELLGGVGFVRYEIANYAQPGHESVHNTAYWTGRGYLGVGPGAHGMFDGSTAAALGLGSGVHRILGELTTTPPQDSPTPPGRVRYAVPASLEEGLVAMPALEVELLSDAEAAREDAMLGLRTARGIDVALARRARVLDVLSGLEVEGLVMRTDDGWCTTSRGWLLGNEVFGRIWLGDS